MMNNNQIGGQEINKVEAPAEEIKEKQEDNKIKESTSNMIEVL